MSGSDNLNVTTVAVGSAQVNGSTTVVPVFATPYSMDSTKQTLAAAGTLPTFAESGGEDYAVVVDNSAGAVTVNLPNVDRNAVGAEGRGPGGHPFRGRELLITNTSTAANIVTLAAPSTGTVQAAPLIDGAASPNTALLPGGARKAVQLAFDGL